MPKTLPLQSNSSSKPLNHDWLNIHNASWTLLLRFLINIIPAKICIFLTYGISFIFYLLSSSQRQAVTQNLSCLHPTWSKLRLVWASYRVFLNFALTYLDRIWSMHFQRNIKWQISNSAILKQFETETGGILIFTIHSGNYDIGASAFANHLQREINIVRLIEKTASLQQLREQELHHPLLKVLYNEETPLLGIQLTNLLAQGNVIAIQGDRVIGSISSTSVQTPNYHFNLPKGPFILAEIAKTPCYPIFITRNSYLNYTIHFYPPLYDGKTRVKVQELTQRWIHLLDEHLQKHSLQWYAFEKTLTPRSNDS
jgi:predicted LPLAT superfamily acyltransferase